MAQDPHTACERQVKPLELLAEVDKDYGRLANGLPIRRPKSKQQAAAEARLAELKAKLQLGEMMPMEYLAAAKAKVATPSDELAFKAAEASIGQEDSSDEDEDEDSDGDDSDEENRAPDPNKCQKCLSSKVDTVVLPCGHAKYCWACAEAMDTCLLCSSAVVQKLKILI